MVSQHLLGNTFSVSKEATFPDDHLNTIFKERARFLHAEKVLIFDFAKLPQNNYSEQRRTQSVECMGKKQGPQQFVDPNLRNLEDETIKKSFSKNKC